MFWTDAAQASERLNGTIVNYDGQPTTIEDVFVDNDNSVACTAIVIGKDRRKKIPLSDEKWKNFRDLPRLGWFNYVSEGANKIVPVFLERKAINARIHGLSTSNTVCYATTPQGVEKARAFYLSDYFKNVGYRETMADDTAYPKLSQILMSLDETPGGVAFSPKFCVIVTEEGMKWLFRKNRRIGFFTGTDSLNLFPKNGFYKEELQACPSFDITNVREF